LIVKLGLRNGRKSKDLSGRKVDNARSAHLSDLSYTLGWLKSKVPDSHSFLACGDPSE